MHRLKYKPAEGCRCMFLCALSENAREPKYFVARREKEDPFKSR